MPFASGNSSNLIKVSSKSMMAELCKLASINLRFSGVDLMNPNISVVRLVRKMVMILLK